MISFIIIGRNEGWKLTKCIVSVFKTIKHNKLNDYEVIYVDSKSTDDSIERVRKFQDVKIFKITGEYNAAIARNIGAKEANGDALFFIDGDMELIPDFLSVVYNRDKGLISSFVSGHWINYYYSNDWKFLSKESFIEKRSDSYESVTGGLFLINMETWEIVGGMRNKYKKSQDIDLGLRLQKYNISLLRKREIAAKHHTIHYFEKKRMWHELINGTYFYSKSIIYRDHCFNKSVYKMLIRNDYTLILLIFLLIYFLFSHNFYIFGTYFLSLLLRALFRSKKIDFHTTLIFLFFALRDIFTILGWFFFWPRGKHDICYEEIK